MSELALDWRQYLPLLKRPPAAEAPEPEAERVTLVGHVLTYHRTTRARTQLDLADLAEVEVFAVAQQCFWHLRQAGHAEAVVPMGIPGEARIRQYLAQWRGFDYDALVRFVSEPPEAGRRHLWPAVESVSVARQ
ncbi:MAG: hypothetical protein ACX931_11255 [Saccharospirillum sp.]